MTERDILRELLEVELSNFAMRLGFISGESTGISYELLLKSLNLLKEISNRRESDFNRQLAIMIVALLWTHAGECRKEGLRQIITPILSSMGFSPSNLMLDQSLKDDGVYSPIASYFDKLRIVANDLKNEIMVAGRPYTLTGFQAELWNVIEDSKLVGISAPTSAGKSFLIYLKIIDMISKGGTRIVYIVPTLSLISQVTSDLSKLLRLHGIGDIEVLNSFEEKIDSFIYVVTQERAIVLFSEQGVRHLDLLVVDEVQNLEKVANEGENRPKILYDVLTDVRNDIDVGKVILSGPRLRNIGNLGFRIFGETSTEKVTDAPPVLSLTYSISKLKAKHFFNLYSTAFDVPIQLEIKNDKFIQGLGQVQYTPKFNEYLHHVLNQLNEDVNVIFSPTSVQARKSASAYAISSGGVKKNIAKECADLGKYLRDSVHPKYELAEMIEHGVAYHTGKTPMHVRKSIEYATSNAWVKTLFCTTTLMQGVNLPAKNVVIRNPNLFTKKKEGQTVSLSAYEFANLRGRAGRLLTDFIGRTIVLDEGAFSAGEEADEGNSMFPDEYKEITTGYQEIYDCNADYINTALTGKIMDDDMPSKSLVTYIRQVLFRHGIEGTARLKNVGLYINENLLKSSLKMLSEIRVSREIVLANRYWDPLDLDRLLKIFNQPSHKFPSSEFGSSLEGHFRNSHQKFPVSIFENKLGLTLFGWVLIMKEEFPFYFNRYLKENLDEKYLYGIAKSAESWARETPLSAILKSRFDSSEEKLDDKIDSEIEKLTKYVSFGLPMLLKPLADMKNQESSIISAIELGVYSPIPKYLTDRGVPRETAIKIGNLHKGKGSAKQAADIDISLIRRNLNAWELQHVNHIL
ncbi:DEAD/DEAH box helicase [Chitinibacteraceae bacterium HSL-7]